MNKNTILNSPWYWIIVAGYVLRIAVMPVTGQHDVLFMPWMTRYINLGHFNLYAFLYEKYGDIVMQRPGVWAPYPYGFYLLTAGWLGILEKIGLVDLATWESVWQVSHPARSVFLFKVAYLLFDLGIGYILYQTGGRMALTLWTWSPTAMYTPFMMGQNDIYPTAFALAGAYAASKTIQNNSAGQSSLNKWAVLSSLFLGIGSIFKIYPLLLLPPLILIIEKRFWHRLALFCIGCSIFGIFSLPFVTTPTYVNGVLFNPEGTRIFREIQIFSVAVPPFLLGYLILLGYLAVGISPASSSEMAYSVCLIVLALLFLWVPTPFYWLIWITPFLIVVVDRIFGKFLVWIVYQLAFVFILLNQHRELGVALPVHLADIFNVPNLPTVLAITQPALYRIFIALLPIVNSLLVAVLLVVIWSSATTFTKRYQSIRHELKLRWWIGLPVAMMFMSLAINLFFSRNLVSHTNWYSWQARTLAAKDHVIQELDPEYRKITGMRLRFTEAVVPVTLEMCLYNNYRDIAQNPIRCVFANTAKQVEDRVLYFLFDNSIFIEINAPLIVKIQLEDTNAAITLPYTTLVTKSLQFNETRLNGMLDISPLSSFSVTEAFDKLVVENILQDVWLVLIICVTTIFVALFLVLLFLNFQISPVKR